MTHRYPVSAILGVIWPADFQKQGLKSGWIPVSSIFDRNWIADLLAALVQRISPCRVWKRDRAQLVVQNPALRRPGAMSNVSSTPDQSFFSKSARRYAFCGGFLILRTEETESKPYSQNWRNRIQTFSESRISKSPREKVANFTGEIILHESNILVKFWKNLSRGFREIRS